MRKIKIHVLLFLVLLLVGCTPTLPHLSSISKIELTFLTNSSALAEEEKHEIKGEITNADDLKYIAETLNSVEVSQPSACLFDITMTVYTDEDKHYDYKIASDGCAEMRIGSDTNFKQYTFKEGQFAHFKNIVADTLLKTEQFPYLYEWKTYNA